MFYHIVLDVRVPSLGIPWSTLSLESRGPEVGAVTAAGAAAAAVTAVATAGAAVTSSRLHKIEDHDTLRMFGS